MARPMIALVAALLFVAACSDSPIENRVGLDELAPPELAGALSCGAPDQPEYKQYRSEDWGPIFDGAVARWWRQNAPAALDQDGLSGTRGEGARDEQGVFRATYTLDDDQGLTQAALGLVRRSGEWRVETSAVCTPPPPTPFPTPDPDDPLGVHRSPGVGGLGCYGQGLASDSSSHTYGPVFASREAAMDRWWGQRPAEGLDRERMTEQYAPTGENTGVLSIIDERGNVQALLGMKRNAGSGKWFVRGWSICFSPSPTLGPNE